MMGVQILSADDEAVTNCSLTQFSKGFAIYAVKCTRLKGAYVIKLLNE
jgi:hypothetical protein